MNVLLHKKSLDQSDKVMYNEQKVKGGFCLLSIVMENVVK